MDERQHRVQAREITARFHQVKALVVASTTIPAADSDRLMGYQVTLERQLSHAVGELLQLQAQALARLSN